MGSKGQDWGGQDTEFRIEPVSQARMRRESRLGEVDGIRQNTAEKHDEKAKPWHTQIVPVPWIQYVESLVLFTHVSIPQTYLLARSLRSDLRVFLCRWYLWVLCLSQISTYMWSLLNVHFNQTWANAVRWNKSFHSKATSKNKWKYLTEDRCQLSVEHPKYYQITTSLLSWSDLDPIEISWLLNISITHSSRMTSSSPDLIFPTYKSVWYDKLSLMSNSFHCWGSLWGCCCLFFFFALSLYCTN